MLAIKDQFRKSISRKFLGKNIIGAITINTFKKAFDQNIQGYVLNGTIFLKQVDQENKIQIYRQKKKLLEIINQKLKKLGYRQKIKEIRFK